MRPPVGAKSSTITSTNNTASNSSNNNNNSPSKSNDNSSSSSTTIKEIRSRTVGSVTNRNLQIANRRQASSSMEKLNSGHQQSSSSSPTTTTTTSTTTLNNSNTNINDKIDKSPSSCGSNSSINGLSPMRNGPLNRTASRVSRFRTAKAVFERLSNNSNTQTTTNIHNNNNYNNINNNNTNTGHKPERPPPPEKVRGAIASRYAAAAAARAAAMESITSKWSQSNKPNSSITSNYSNAQPSKSRNTTASLARSQDVGKSTSNSDLHKIATNEKSTPTPNSSSSGPKPQPRVVGCKQTASQYKNTQEISPIAPTNATTTSTITKLDDQSSNMPITVGISANNPTATQLQIRAQPPPKDLIDKIVQEISQDAPDPDSTIQDLSNCDISGIPETLDFDKCFQDVEMMTEEEARQLLSRKTSNLSSSSSLPLKDINSHQCTIVNHQQVSAIKSQVSNHLNENENQDPKPQTTNLIIEKQIESAVETNQYKENDIINKNRELDLKSRLLPSNNNSDQQSIINKQQQQPSNTPSKAKVRFSDEPVTVFQTHAVEDYDRRNEDIDPVAASAEYEIEKSKERQDGDSTNLLNQDDFDKQDQVVITTSQEASDLKSQLNRFKVNQNESSDATQNKFAKPSQVDENIHQTSHVSTESAQSENAASIAAANAAAAAAAAEEADNTKAYIESLEREVGLKRILEQNLRDLQSQYYESVRELDDYRSSQETKMDNYEASICDLKGSLEVAQNELSDRDEQTKCLRKEFNDIKESSQLLEKKYHRAKKIIKDMQSREQSFTRREQLYQQKLDEIEFELSQLIDSINNTINNEAINYVKLVKENINNTTINNNNNKNEFSTSDPIIKAQINVFGLINKILDNFTNKQECQNPQIKQRVASILEQKLSQLIASHNNNNNNGLMTNNNLINQSDMTTTTNLQQQQHQDLVIPVVDCNGTLRRSHPIGAGLDATSYMTNRMSCPAGVNIIPNPPPPPPPPPPAMINPLAGLGPLANSKFFNTTNQTNNNNIIANGNGGSPPHSVNSYPSSNSLNSLSHHTNPNNNNNNNNSFTINNNNLVQLNSKINNNKSSDQVFSTNIIKNNNLPISSQIMGSNEQQDNNIKYHSTPDVQNPYKTDEWHDKPVSEWTTTQVSTWLLALGLDQYISKFEDRNVNGQSLVNLDSTLLKGFGVLNSNDRNLLKKKIRELRADMERERKLFEKKLQKDKSKGKFLI